jgi:hypothetical protein
VELAPKRSRANRATRLAHDPGAAEISSDSPQKKGRISRRKRGTSKTYIGVFSDSLDDRVVKGASVASEAARNVVRVLETSQRVNVEVREAGPVLATANQGKLASLPERSDRRLVHVRDPVVVLSGRGIVDVLLEDYNITVWNLMLSRGRRRQQRSSVLVYDGGVIDGGCNRDRDGGKEHQKLG